jgi:hypothetical protein
MKDAISDFGGTAPERNEVAGYTSYKEEMAWISSTKYII